MPLSVLVSYRRDRDELIATVLLEMLVAGNFDFDDLIKARRDLPSQMPPAYSALPECLDDLADTAEETLRKLRQQGLGVARSPEEAGAVRDVILQSLKDETATKVRQRWRFPKHLVPPGEPSADEPLSLGEALGAEADPEDVFVPLSAIVEADVSDGPLPPPVEGLQEVDEGAVFERQITLQMEQGELEEPLLDDELYDTGEFDFSTLDDVEAPAESEITKVVSLTDLESRLPTSESEEQVLPESGLQPWESGTPSAEEDEVNGLRDEEPLMSGPESPDTQPEPSKSTQEGWDGGFGSEMDLLQVVADELDGDSHSQGAGHIVARDPLNRRVAGAGELQPLLQVLQAAAALPLDRTDSPQRLLDWWEGALSVLERLGERWSHEPDGSAGIAVSGAVVTEGFESLLAILGRNAQVMERMAHRLKVETSAVPSGIDADAVEQVYETLATMVTVVEHLSEGRGFSRNELEQQFAHQPSMVEALVRLTERAEAWERASSAKVKVLEPDNTKSSESEKVLALQRQIQEMDEESRHLRVLAAWGRLRALLAELRFEVTESVKPRGMFKDSSVPVHDRPEWMRRQWEDIHRYMGVLQNKLPDGALHAEAAQIRELASFLEPIRVSH